VDRVEDFARQAKAGGGDRIKELEDHLLEFEWESVDVRGG